RPTSWQVVPQPKAQERFEYLVAQLAQSALFLAAGSAATAPAPPRLIKYSQCTNRRAIDSLNLQWKPNKLEFLPDQFVEIGKTLNDRDMAPQQYFVNRPRLLLVCRVHPVLARAAFMVLQARRVAAHASYSMLYQPFGGLFSEEGLREHSARLGLGIGEQEEHGIPGPDVVLFKVRRRDAFLIGLRTNIHNHAWNNQVIQRSLIDRPTIGIGMRPGVHVGTNLTGEANPC